LLNDIYVGLKGSKQIVVEQYTKEQAKEALSEIRSFKIRLVNFSNKIEKINYFEDGEVKELVKHCSRAMNELEISLRKKAFKGERKSSTSPELLQAISNKSKEALTKSLFAQ
jgi:translation initiation factor IF-2